MSAPLLLLVLVAAASDAVPAGPVVWSLPAESSAMAPWLSPDGDGLLASWIERGDDGHVMRTARMAADGTWTTALKNAVMHGLTHAI